MYTIGKGYIQYHKDEVIYIDFSETFNRILIRRLEPPTGKVEWYWIPIPTMSGRSSI